ncbi:MAG: DUF2752 domain-containing protein [Phycisphaerales bacterium]|nr:DUF2752 domain-containing protein [Phycisphaerales bacterium]
MPAMRPARARLIAAGVAGAGVFVLTLAAWLTPDPSGMGTHRQLGLPPCNMVILTGHPCPSCGMTTAFAHAVRGRFLSALRTQPAGFLLALATMIASAAALSTLTTGKAWYVNPFVFTPARVAATAVTIVLASWAYKLVAWRMGGA